MMFHRIDGLEKMPFISDSFWQNDDIEIMCDKLFLKNAF